MLAGNPMGVANAKMVGVSVSLQVHVTQRSTFTNTDAAPTTATVSCLKSRGRPSAARTRCARLLKRPRRLARAGTLPPPALPPRHPSSRSVAALIPLASPKPRGPLSSPSEAWTLLLPAKRLITTKPASSCTLIGPQHYSHAGCLHFTTGLRAFSTALS